MCVQGFMGLRDKSLLGFYYFSQVKFNKSWKNFSPVAVLRVNKASPMLHVIQVERLNDEHILFS